MSSRLPTHVLTALLVTGAPAAALAQQPAAAAPSAEGPQQPGQDATPADASGSVRGTVIDAKTGEPLIEATVKVVQGGPAREALTDVDGRYTLELPPGTYDLRVFYDVYAPRRIGRVQVRAGEATALDVKLAADASAVQEVVVTARKDRRAEGALLTERRKAPAVQDVLSAQEIARTPDASAGDAVKRVVSATVVGGRYVYLRGLGGRYSTTLLNGAPLPSPEPDEQAVPLDLFPTSLVANMNVLKSYTADLPGTFAGGVLSIEANTYPERFELRPRVSLSSDTETLLQPRSTYAGGALDGLGFDDGTRAVPAGVPINGPLEAGRGGRTLADVAAVARGFSNTWTLQKRRGLPNLGVSASVGDTVRLGGRPLGYLVSAGYAYKESAEALHSARVVVTDGGASGLGLVDPMLAARGAAVGGLNGLLSAGWKPADGHELTWLTLATRTGESRAEDLTGRSDALNFDIEGTRLQFVQRTLVFNQLSGEHALADGDAGKTLLSWQANYSLAARNEPDTRDLLYSLNEDGSRYFRNNPGAGDRFWADLTENAAGLSGDVALPLGFAALKLGVFGQGSVRGFDLRRFIYRLSSSADPAVSGLGPDAIFAPGNVGTAFNVREDTGPTDGYHALLGLGAAFASLDAQVLPALRVVAGVRAEASAQRLDSRSRFSTGTSSVPKTDAAYFDLLPTLNATLALGERANLRAGYSYTLARPTFRELAPLLYFDFVRRRTVSGNPELDETRIHNLDARGEWFFGDSELVAASVFYKRFLDPIERVLYTPQGDVSFQNAPRADSLGLELEGRLSLGRLAPALAPFKLGANATLLRNEVRLGAAQGVQTSARRPMQGQSPYVVNASASYERPEAGTELSVLYNVYGARIAEVGIQGVPDLYEQAFHRLDLAFNQKLGQALQLKLTATNLLNQPVRLVSGGLTVVEYRSGVGFGLTLGATL